MFHNANRKKPMNTIAILPKNTTLAKFPEKSGSPKNSPITKPTNKRVR